MSFGNTTAGTGATALPLPEPAVSELGRRLVSAAVIAPVGLAAIHVGGAAFLALLALVVVGLAWEWDRLCGGRPGWPAAALGATGLGTLGAVALGRPELSPGIAAAGTLASLLVAHLVARPHPRWLALGALAIALPAAALLWLRADPDWGRATVLWLVLVVVATDIGAYAAGRAIGGPHLAPRTSPHKTWAGLAGGMAAAALTSGAVAWAADAPWLVLAGVLGALLAVVAQAGDLAESAAKRRFGVKDTSTLIPGHGGLFDRLDGVLAAAPAVAVASLLAGRPPLAWS